jgi:hypothetical protein
MSPQINANERKCNVLSVAHLRGCVVCSDVMVFKRFLPKTLLMLFAFICVYLRLFADLFFFEHSHAAH